MKLRPTSYVLLILLVFLARSGRCQSSIQLRDATAHSELTFRHVDGGSGQRYIVEYISAGVVALDYDGDGLVDLYFLNGGQLKGASQASPPTNRLFRNLGDLVFKDVTADAGVGDMEHGLGAAAADFDNDGDQDIFVSNFGANVLYINQGDGTFARDSVNSCLVCPEAVGAGVNFLDADQDGDLDLFCASYVDFRFENHVGRKYRGQSVYASPQDYAPVSDFFFRNEGDGRFVDLSEESGVARVAGTGMGSVAFDFDQDGDTDVFVCNDVMANFLYQNDGTGRFDEVGLLSGVAFDFAGVPQGSMGVACGDVNGDGHLDLIVTSYQDESSVLYRNSGQGFFEDLTVSSGDLRASVPDVTWGVGLADLDLDADLDLFMASGHLMDNVQSTDDTQNYAAKNLLFANDGHGNFKDVSTDSGDGLQPVAVSRGTAACDFDNDGDTDIVVLNSNAEPTLIETLAEELEAHWIELQLSGRQANRDGVGCRVEVSSGGRIQVQETHSGLGYQGHHGMRLHFGLGSQPQVDWVKVHWLGGEAETFQQLESDQIHILTQGDGN